MRVLYPDFNAGLKNFQYVLSECLFGDTSDEHLSLVVPRQGNLLNPMQAMNCSAYFTYYNSLARRIIPNRDYGANVNTLVEVSLELQCVGIDAEAFMLSTLFWDSRTDVQDAFARVHSQLKNTDREIRSNVYFQDGANTVLSYDTTLTIISALHLDIHEDRELRQLVTQGSVIQGD